MVVRDGFYNPSSLKFTIDEVFYSNTFFLLLYDKNTITNIAHLINSEKGIKEVIYEFPFETGIYTLETRVNGSKNDVKTLHDYYFTKGKKYIIRTVIDINANYTIWDIEEFSMREVIDSIDVTLGEKIEEPNLTLYKPDYTMSDIWYIDQERTKIFDFNTPISGDLKLYANMTKK